MAEENLFYPSNHTSSTASKKLRLMCSNGGHIVPRPHDKSLCYIGGETRMVVVDRHITLRDLTLRLSKTLIRSSSSPTASFLLKYQLPSEDLDSLISITNDEDLENMIEEYERLNSSSSATLRLRLFMFPTNPESVSSIGSFLENSSKSEDWFLNALNGTTSGFSDTSSVNCLLGLDDEIEISLPEKKDVNHKGAIVTNFPGNNSGQDVHSIPDSPMMETTSSFGSASSTPSLANLPPIRVNAVDHQKVVGGGTGIEEQFSQMNVQQRHQDDAGFVASPVPVMVSGSPMTVVPELPDPFFSSQQMQSTLSGLTLTDQSSPVVQIQSPNSNNPAADPIDTLEQNTKIQTQQQKIPYSAYLHHQQLQFIPPQRYIHHHHHPSGAVPVASYYHHPQMDDQNFMYYMPSKQPAQGYNFPFQADALPVAATQVPLKSEFPADVYRAKNSGAPQLVRVPSIPQNHPQYIYATHSMPPFQYQKMTSSSPIEACLQEQQLRTAQP